MSRAVLLIITILAIISVHTQALPPTESLSIQIASIPIQSPPSSLLPLSLSPSTSTSASASLSPFFTRTLDVDSGSSPTVLKIAYIGPLNMPNINSAQFGQRGLFSFILAVNYFNRLSANWRENTSLPMPLLPNIILEPIYYDSRSEAGTTLNAAFDAITAGAIAIVGEWQTMNTQQIQYLAARFKVPQISPGATGLELIRDHSTAYPYFIRNIPNVGIQGYQMAHLIRGHFGWRKIGIVHASDSFGTGGFQTMAQLADQIDLTIVSQVTYNIGDTEFDFQIARLAASGARIIVYWGLVTDLQALWRAIKAGFLSGKNPNLLGNSYQWIINHSAVTQLLYKNSSGDILPDMIDIMPGLIGLNFYLNTSTPVWREFDRLHSSTPPLPITPLVQPNSTGSGFVWDAVEQIVRGLDFMYQHGLDPRLMENRPSLYESIRNRTFTGTTGPIHIDSNGERIMGFGVYNFQRSTRSFVGVGLMTGTGEYLHFPSVGPIEFQGDQPYVKPSDTPPKPIVTIKTQLKNSLILTASILMIGVLFVQLYIFLRRHHPLIKGSSPLFLLLFLLGVQLLCASVIARSLESNPRLFSYPCNADLYLANLGYTLVAGALCVKTFRLQAIFNLHQLKTQTKLRDDVLLGMLAILMCAESVILLGLQYGKPLSVQISSYDTEFDYYSCRSTSGDNEAISVYLPVTISTRFALLATTALMAYRVRHVSDLFNESKQLGITVYNLLLLSALLPAIDGTMGRGRESSLIAYSICVFVICVTTVCIMLVPKFVVISQHSAMVRAAAKELNQPHPNRQIPIFDSSHLSPSPGENDPFNPSSMMILNGSSCYPSSFKPVIFQHTANGVTVSIGAIEGENGKDTHHGVNGIELGMLPPSTIRTDHTSTTSPLSVPISSEATHQSDRPHNSFISHQADQAHFPPPPTLDFSNASHSYNFPLPPQPLMTTDDETLIGSGGGVGGRPASTSTRRPLTFHMSENVVRQFMQFLAFKHDLINQQQQQQQQQHHQQQHQAHDQHLESVSQSPPQPTEFESSPPLLSINSNLPIAPSPQPSLGISHPATPSLIHPPSISPSTSYSSIPVASITPTSTSTSIPTPITIRAYSHPPDETTQLNTSPREETIASDDINTSQPNLSRINSNATLNSILAVTPNHVVRIHTL